LGIGAAFGATSNVLNGLEQKQSGPQLWEDAGIGAVTGATSNLNDSSGVGLYAGFVTGGINGVGAQMIGNRSRSLTKVNGLWVLGSGGLGAAENWAGYAATKDIPVKDASPGNYVSGGVGIDAGGVCGVLDELKLADC
jgi:hypothetical protein